MQGAIPRRLRRPLPLAGGRLGRPAGLAVGPPAAPEPPGALDLPGLTRPCCTKAQRLRRRLRVEVLLEAGLESPARIAEALAREGIIASARQVRDDLRRVEAEWREAYLGRRIIWLVRLVRRAERRIAELEAEWERSKQDRVLRRRRETAGGPGRAVGGRVETEVVVETRLGDPAYLAEARRNDEFIARLLGLFDLARCG